MNIENSVRFIYELMTKNDAGLLFKLDQYPEVMRYINGGNAHRKKYIEKFILHV